ncbi:MAG: Hsp20/alpha crystallin family protein [Gammaproteobacteria bacterium]|nr:MAG: Hsp20/alpha crystallin family protein [Gammaproteobacteria bacterium]
MSNTQEVTKQTEAGAQGRPQAREAGYTLVPPVDIFEDADGVSLVLDMPGVTKDRLRIEAEREALVVEGEAAINVPDGIEPAYAEIRSTRYRRSFTLTSELDADRIEASLKDGVLSLRIPKRAELKPRRIEVQAA